MKPTNKKHISPRSISRATLDRVRGGMFRLNDTSDCQNQTSDTQCERLLVIVKATTEDHLTIIVNTTKG